MPIYKAPLRDMQFVFHELFNADEKLASLPGYNEVSADLVDAILEEGAKIAEEVMLPINFSGDDEGCSWNNGQVKTPSGFPEAYKIYIEGGWPALAGNPEYGGQGMPESIAFLLEEMLCSTNVSFSLYPGLTRGAINSLSAHGSDELKNTYLPNMTEGIWAGTMCLTESHSGTDLGLIRTKAVPQDGGSYAISGTKIFITGGEQDLTENIIHLTLARLPDAPEGVRGISLFLVPKFLVNADGSLGERNGVSCGSIEHKMGIKASSTCVMNFDGAIGYLVGPANKGMACMFTMMNTERLAIGMQGLGLGEIAYQNAVEYARERIQGRSATGPKATDKAADPILVHPDVRRMLLTARAYNEGSRALATWVSLNLDLMHKDPDPQGRETAEDLVALLTPVVKAFFSDYGFEVTNLCQQVFGGHGYVKEWGMEQFVRDVRIAQIYEGTNGVQALDLVRRKLRMHDGRLAKRFFNELEGFVTENRDSSELEEFISPLGEALTRLKSVTQWIVDQENPDEPCAAATEYLRLFALTTLAYLWARMAKISSENMTGENTEFYSNKKTLARFYFQRLLPQSVGLEKIIRAGANPIMELDESAF